MVRHLLILALCAWLPLAGCQSVGGSRPDSTAATDIDMGVDASLQRLYATTPAARKLAQRASGMLVFPGIVRAGFIGGAKYGTGALREKGRTTGYYNIVAGSYGLQAGVQTYDYAMFFIGPSALNDLKSSQGWEIGSAPTIVVADTGVANALTTTTIKDNVYVFIFGQKGLMAGLGLQGSKITRFNP